MKKLLPLILLLFVVGCSSAPVIIPAAERIKNLASDPSIMSLPRTQRTAVTDVLKQAEKEVTKAKKEEQKAAAWSEFGKRAVFAIGGVAFAVLAFIAAKIFL